MHWLAMKDSIWHSRTWKERCNRTYKEDPICWPGYKRYLNNWKTQIQRIEGEYLDTEKFLGNNLTNFGLILSSVLLGATINPDMHIIELWINSRICNFVNEFPIFLNILLLLLSIKFYRLQKKPINFIHGI